MDTQIISLANQKGGVGKTTTCANLGIGLAREGKRVLLVDCDPQASLTLSLGWRKPETLPVTLATLMGRILQEQPVHAEEAILHHAEGVDLIPGNIALSGVEASLDTRQNVLKRVLDDCRKNYSHVLLDCMPSLGMMTINSLVAADSVLIPSQPNFLSAKGLGLLLKSIGKVKRQINPKLRVDGVLLTMVDNRTNNAKAIIASLRQTGSGVKVFDTEIPFSVRAAEATLEGKSIFAHDKSGKVAAAYEELTKEVMMIEQRENSRFRSENGIR